MLRKGYEEEEAPQAKLLKRQEEEEEEEVQSQPEEEEKTGQAKLLQRKTYEEEEVPQAKFLQKQEEEAEVQSNSEEEEEVPQAKLWQRQEGEEEPVQAKGKTGTGTSVSSDVESSIQSSKGGGQAISEQDREFFEPRFGADFSKVRIHTDSNATQLSRQLNAQAFTVGSNIYFGAGHYNPQTTQGKKLIGHELTHVVQQGGASSLQAKQHQKNSILRKPVISQQRASTPDVQCGFWDDPWGTITSTGSRVWNGIQSIGRSIGRGARASWNWIRGIGRSVGKGLQSAWSWIRSVGRTIGRGVVAAWSWIRQVGRAIGRGITAAWEWIKSVGRAIGRGIMAAWDWIKSVGRAIGRGILAAWEWIKQVASRIGRALLDAWNWIKALARKIGRALLWVWEWLKRIGRPIWECIKGLVFGAGSSGVQRKMDRKEEGFLTNRLQRKPAMVNGNARATPLLMRKQVNITKGLQPVVQRYGEDIHYYKTLEDAVDVGYGPIEAGTVAFEDQAVDTGWRHPWITTPAEIVNPRVSGKDMLHFPGRGVAIGDMRRAIAACDLKAFGAGLHRFQDTFSHNFTTWKTPLRRTCASWCWKINPLLAAAILIPNPAYGRAAALKHACLGFYPDEHHPEQKARDASMRTMTRSWLKQFLTKCPHRAALKFTSKSFSAGTGGNLAATPGATRVTLMSPLYNPSGSVEVSGGTDPLAQQWETGFIQTMHSAQRKAHFIGSKKEKLRTVSIPGPRRDAFVQTGAPWYDPNNQNSSAPVSFTKTNSTEKSRLKDNPATRPPWDTPDGKGKLDHHEGKDTFTAWMVARKKTAPHHVEYINWTSWEVGYGCTFNYASSGAKTVKKITGKTKNTGSGLGKGANASVLSGTIANTELNSNIVWS